MSAGSTFDTELVSKVMFELKFGKAPDANGLTAEHLIRAHPILPITFSKLYQLVLLRKQVGLPLRFGHSYIEPVPKSSIVTWTVIALHSWIVSFVSSLRQSMLWGKSNKW